MNNNDMQLLVEAIMTLDDDELDRVWTAAKARHDQLRIQAKAQFAPGDQVEWDSKYGKVMSGTVVKLMQKNVKVKVEDDRIWHVSPTLLRSNT